MPNKHDNTRSQKVIAKRIAEYRAKACFTQLQLSELLDVSIGTIQLWEKGTTAPRFNSARRLAQLFGVPISEFICEKQPDKTKKAPPSPFK